MAAARDQGLEVGDRLHTRGVDWLIVGEFEFDGDSSEGELFGDVATVTSETKQHGYGLVTVQLQSAAEFDRFEKALTADPALHLGAQRETDYDRYQSSYFDKLLGTLGYAVAAIMAVGAVSAAVNAMYAAVEQRRVEIATLRAVGFGGVPVAISIVLETLAIALPGAVLGTLIAYLGFDNHATESSGVIFRLLVTPGLVAEAFAWTGLIALLGGLPPAIRAARVPITTGLSGH